MKTLGSKNDVGKMQGGEDFDTKLRYLAKQIVWIVIGLFIFLFTAICIYVGYQYIDDECVRQTPYTLALDWWLISGCVYDVVVWLIVMVLLCCRVRHRCRRAITLPLHFINVVWMGVGIWLLVESQLRCQHNTLWAMSLALVCITLTLATLIVAVLCCAHFGVCAKLGRYVMMEDVPYNYVPVGPLPLFDNDN